MIHPLAADFRKLLNDGLTVGDPLFSQLAFWCIDECLADWGGSIKHDNDWHDCHDSVLTLYVRAGMPE